MINKPVFQSALLGLAAICALTFSACNKFATEKGSNPAQGSSPANLVLAKPDAAGKMKCPNGDDAIKVKGPCPGAWHFEKMTGQ
jgi:hypothetical protein